MNSLFCFVQHWALGSSADEAFILSNGDLGNLAGVATGHLCVGQCMAMYCYVWGNWQLATYVWGWVRRDSSVFQSPLRRNPYRQSKLLKKWIDGWYGYNLDAGLLWTKVMVMMGVGTSPVRDGKSLRISTLKMTTGILRMAMAMDDGNWQMIW